MSEKSKRGGYRENSGSKPHPPELVAAVKRLRPMGWADFKHKLVARGVMAKPDANVPQDWVDAFLKAHGRVRRRA